MKIRCAGPMRGRREPLCKTDEATLSKLFTKGGREMVERLQPLDDTPQHFVLAFTSWDFGTRLNPKKPAYHLIKALALEFAHSLFPENFLTYHELRFFRKGSLSYSAAYSDVIPDDTGVIARRRAAMRSYYAASDDAAKNAIKEEANAVERSLNPDIPLLVNMVGGAGVGIAHPEANYHIHDGRTIFFEVGTLDLSSAIQFARAAGAADAIGLLAMIYSIEIHNAAGNYTARTTTDDLTRRCCMTYLSKSFSELKEIFHSIFMHDHLPETLLVAGGDVVKYPVSHHAAYGTGLRRWHDISEGSLALDPATSESIDRILRNQY
ncbi:MAG: hypothetical protein AB1295_04345 [Candidatus Micrarchaeota archaeon]